tara:strand:+ start:6425 stop:7240 length:816 start_codon:yes stop_codon:yes gene_type:complete
MNSVALVGVIEGNLNNINISNGPLRLLEQEAIKCFRSWRKNGGSLANIDIYCICITENTPTQHCINVMTNYGVTYIHEYLPESDKFKNGWWNKPLACSYMENYLHHDIIIHIDLDMYLLREIQIDVNRNSCLVYDETDALQERTPNPNSRLYNHRPYNTCYITAKRRDHLFTQWYDCLRVLEQDINMIREYYNDVSYDKLEEAAMDVLGYTDNKRIDIIPVEDIMFGETYTPLSDMNSYSNISFHHYHIYNKNNLSKYNYISNEAKFKHML